MRLTLRKTFAILLLVVALVPPALFVGFHQDPAGTMEAARLAGLVVFYAVTGSLAVLAFGLLLYPPFPPQLRLAWQGVKSRLSTNSKPLYDALYKLQHLETHTDRLSAGRMAKDMGNLPVAMENLMRAVEMEPDHLPSRFHLGTLMAQVGQPGPAVELLTPVVQEDPEHGYGEALRVLAMSLAKVDNHEPARDLLRRHQELFPGSRQVHLALAQVLAKLGDSDGSKTELEAAARPKQQGERLSAIDDLARARAKVIGWRGGKFV